MPPPIITLTTDFGLSDHYVGVMKGVILSRCPGAQIVDISHEIPAFSIYAGGYTIRQAAPYFPQGSIHVVVIDPGVGTQRKPLLVHALGQIFIAPDNGVLTFILAADAAAEVREITDHNLWLPCPSATFHGRDIFAPTAAAVASGRASGEEVGPIIDNCVLLSSWRPHPISANVHEGIALSVDHFGNVITSFPSSEFSLSLSNGFSVETEGGDVIEMRSTFGEAAPDSPFVYKGSSGFLELGINRGNAALRLRVVPGSAIRLRVG